MLDRVHTYTTLTLSLEPLYTGDYLGLAVNRGMPVDLARRTVSRVLYREVSYTRKLSIKQRFHCIHVHVHTCYSVMDRVQTDHSELMVC